MCVTDDRHPNRHVPRSRLRARPPSMASRDKVVSTRQGMRGRIVVCVSSCPFLCSSTNSLLPVPPYKWVNTDFIFFPPCFFLLLKKLRSAGERPNDPHGLDRVGLIAMIRRRCALVNYHSPVARKRECRMSRFSSRPRLSPRLNEERYMIQSPATVKYRRAYLFLFLARTQCSLYAHPGSILERNVLSRKAPRRHHPRN